MGIDRRRRDLVSDDIESGRLEAWCSDLISQLEPAARRTLAREVAKGLRESQAKRIAAQKNPDGSDYAPRKPQLKRKVRPGRVRGMFAKLRTSKYLSVESTSDVALVTFAGEVQRIARVHHYGLRDRINKRGLTVQYAARELLGFTDPEVEQIKGIIIAHLAGG